MKKFIAVLVLIFLVAGVNSEVYSASIDSQIKTQQKNQSDMKKKIQRYNSIAKEKSKQSKTLLGQLSKLKKDASASEAKMNDLENETSKLSKSVEALNKRIKDVNASMSKIIAILKERVPELYKLIPEENNLSLILNSENPHDAVNTAYMLKLFAKNDQKMLNDLTQQENELIEARKKLEEDKSKILKQTDELKKKRAEYDSTIKQTDTLLRNVQSEQKQAEAAVKELENAQRAVGSKINSLMKQKKAAQTKAAPQKTSAKTQTASSKNQAVAKTQSQPSSTSRKAPGALSWPVNGTVTMQYGSRVHPTFKTKIFNSGIDIKASSGAPVKAAGAGEVLYQGWLRGFGQVIIIDHGGDLSTVYAHLGGASVREGASVKAGTIIGRVGNSGTNSEYGLHFEVRKNGSAVNPMNYLR